MRTAIIGIYGEKVDVGELKCQIKELVIKLHGKENIRTTGIKRSERFDNFGTRIYVRITKTTKMPLRLPEEVRR